MGAWSESVFGNDDAADFSLEFDGANTTAKVTPIIENALDAVLESTPDLEAPEAAIGLAAAALVVAWTEPRLLGNDFAYAPEPWPRTSEPLPEHLKVKAAAVLNRMKVAAGNELAQLWAESGQTSEFIAEIDRWRSALS
ncbi:DUF4259 domain-containing protein [Cryobacterium sp. MDB2-33-2]|uniref:DUF4259 domain-containing protein n=1 Tax=Cryobacterium sp. MDB2-33-2 TaxID=1259179 RepID=UPI00106BB76D|nr:DUF4259 domain-containing protein [Cryobacterium sp. MDB2-33-2]TFC06531.1 DUF4259 domain-containing protein [Cryobacterium sp. MDB2-33-2]